MDHWQYLIVLGGVPGDHRAARNLRGGVYRQPWRAFAPCAGRAGLLGLGRSGDRRRIWTYNPPMSPGSNCPAHIPIEEVLFFLVIPICGLLTYSAVNAMLGRIKQLRSRSDDESSIR